MRGSIARAVPRRRGPTIPALQTATAKHLNTSTDKDRKTAARTPGNARTHDATAPQTLPQAPLLRTVLVATCGWPTEAASVSRRRTKPRGSASA